MVKNGQKKKTTKTTKRKTIKIVTRQKKSIINHSDDEVSL